MTAQIRRWRENGLPRDEVRELRSFFDGTWPDIIATENRDKGAKAKGSSSQFGPKRPALDGQSHAREKSRNLT